MNLRPYQIEAVGGAVSALRTHRSTLLVLATGCGKTVIFSHIAKMASRGRVMVLAHREELIHQAAAKLKAATGEEPEIEMAGLRADTHFFRRSKYVVSSVQTQLAGMGGAGRMTRFDPKQFALVIVDEAHHAVSPSYRTVIDYYMQNPSLKVLGVTATADRADEKALGKVFESVAFEFSVLDAIDGGWLVPIRQNVVHVTDLDFSKVHTRLGDLNTTELAEIMEDETNLHEIAGPTVELAADRKTIVFTVSVKQADRTAEIINRIKPGSAAFVCGETPQQDRRRILRDFSIGKIQFLVNVGVLTEGFDDPGIEVVAIARPTKSRPLYCQMVGRGTRPLPGLVDDCTDASDRKDAIASSAKPALTVLDFVGNSGRHKLITTVDILGDGEEDEVVERARKAIEKGEEDTQKAIDEARESLAEERRRKREAAERRKGVVATAQFSVRDVDPFNVLDIPLIRDREWDRGKKPTEKMLNLLRKNGFAEKALKDMSFRQASAIIGKIMERREAGLCTPKQAKALRQFGIDAKGMSFEDASKRLDMLIGNKKAVTA